MAKSAPQTTSSDKPQLILADALEGIAQRAQASASAAGAAIALVERGATNFVCRARSGSTAPALGLPLQVEGSFTGLCVQSGEALHCADSETDDRVDTAVIRALGIRSMIVVPIKDPDTVIGVLAVFSSLPGAFTTTHLSVLKTMADKVAGLVGAVHFGGRSPESIVPFRYSKRGEHPERDNLVLATAPSLSIATVNTPNRKPAGTLLLRCGVAALLISGAASFLLISKLRSAIGGQRARPVSTLPAGSPPQDLALSTKIAPRPAELGLAKKPIPPSGLPRSAQEAKHAGSDTPHQVPAESAALVPAAPPPRTQPVEPEPIQPHDVPPVPQDGGSLSAILSRSPTIVPRLQTPVESRQPKIEPPQLVHSTPVVYPEFARQKRIQSTVLLKARIAKDGTVAKAEFLSGLPIFRDAALDAVRKWRYKPAMRDGQAIERQIVIQLEFHP